MKKLTDMQKSFIINSALNNGCTIEQAEAKVVEKELEINKPKKQAFNWAIDEEDESGMM